MAGPRIGARDAVTDDRANDQWRRVGDLVDRAIALHAVRTLFSRVVEVQMVGSDHVTQVRLAASSRAHSGHGETRWPEISGQRRERDDCIRRTHPPGLSDHDAERPATHSLEVAVTQREVVGAWR